MSSRKLTLKPIDGTYDSVLAQVQMLLNELNDLSKKAKRDYNEVKRYTNSGDEQSVMALEDVRKNSLNSLRDYFDLRVKVIKLYSDVSKNINDNNLKKSVDDTVDHTANNDYDTLMKMANDLKSKI